MSPSDADPLPPGAVARLGTLRFRHHEPVQTLAISSDGKRVASTGFDGTVCLWDRATGKLDHKLCVIRPAVKQPEKKRKENSESSQLVFAPDGSVLVIATEEDVSVWSATTGRLLHLQHLKAGSAPAFSGDGRWLAVEVDGDIHVLATRTGQERCVIATKRTVECLALSPDGSLLAVPLHKAGVVRLYDVATGRKLRTYETGEWKSTIALFSPDGKRLVAAARDGPVCVWNPGAEEPLIEFTTDKEDAPVLGLTFDAGSRLAFLFADGSVLRYDVANGIRQKALDAKVEVGDDPVVFALSDDGKHLAHAVGEVLRVRDLEQGKDVPDLGAPTQYTTGTWVPRSDVVALQNADGSLHFWDPRKGDKPRCLTAPKDTGFLPVFAPDGRTVLLVDKEVGLRLCDISTGGVVREIPLDKDNELRSAAFAPEGRWLLVVGKNDIRLVNTATGKERPLQEVELADGMGDAAFTAAGRGFYVQWNPTEVHFWELATGKERRVLRLIAPATCLAVSPDGAVLAAGENDGGVRIYQVGRETVLHRLADGSLAPRGDADRAVRALAWSPGGRLLASGGDDGVVHLWDPVAGREVRRLEGLGGKVASLAFSADGRSLVTVGSTVLVWDVAAVLALPKARGPMAEVRSPADLWADLASEDVVRADAAVRVLVEQPAEGLVLLKERLRPVPPVEAARLSHLAEDLDSDDFTTRQRASKELRALGRLAEPTLRRLVEGQHPLEVRRAADELLAVLDDMSLDADELRALRAVEVLEGIGTPEARLLLQTLAAGGAGARLTEEARAAAARLRRRADAPH